MISARHSIRSTVPRAARSARVSRHSQLRFQSSTSSSPPSSGGTPWVAGVLGGVVGASLFYGAYSFTPSGRTASSLNKAVIEAEKKYHAAAKKLQQKTPSADEAVESMKQLAYSYVGWVPGGRASVDVAFRDWDKVRENHKDEADQIVTDAYKQFQDVSKSGLSLVTATRAYEILADLTKKIANLTGDAISDVLDNHPQVKEKLGGNVDQLKRLGETYGPEARQQVDQTWKQVKDIFANGFSDENVTKARKLVEEKLEDIRKLGDQAWSRAFDEAKPYLEKNPKVKELLEKNADALKQGNAKELFDRAKSAVDSGNFADLEGYVKKFTDKAKSSAESVAGNWGSLDQFAKLLPHGEEIIPKLKELREITEKHTEKGEKLLQETVEELKEVLEKKAKKAQEIVDQAKKEAKS